MQTQSSLTTQHPDGSSSRPVSKAADRLLLRVGRQGRSWTRLLVATAIAGAVAETTLPAVLGRALDAAMGTAPKVWLGRCAAVVVLLAMCDVLDEFAVGAVTSQCTRWLRREVLGHIVALGPRAVRRFPPGDLAARIVGNAADAGTIVPEAVRALANLLPAIGGTIALALIDPSLCVTFFIGVPVFALLVRTFARDASDIARRYLETQGKIAGRLVDALSGIRTIAAAGSVDREIARVLEPLPELHEHGVAMWRAQLKVSVETALLVPLMEILVLAVAGARLAQGAISPGEMFAAGQYVLLATTLGSAVNAANRLARARAGAQRAAEILEEPAPAYGDRHLRPGRGGGVEFRNVTVRGDSGPILDALSLVIPPGALVAVVGSSGVGKSTLAAMAGRLVDPDEGEVLVDGVPLPRLSRDDLRAAVTYGFERPALIGETIADVIAFGHYRPDDEEIVAAARAAQADVFIRRMPHSYLTRLTDAPMSGGETQRLGVARAFAHAGRVLVFDDVAASLDTATEHEISEVLTREFGERTRLVVAHRVSTASRADLVVWLDGGRVREIGRHQDLWRGEAYRAVFRPYEYDAARRVVRHVAERMA